MNPFRSPDTATTTVAGTTVGLTVMGVSLSDWASILAIVWLLVNILFKVLDYFNKEN